MGIFAIDFLRNRRIFAACASFAFVLLALTTDAAAEERTIELYNIHTKKEISIVYKRDGKFDQDALKKLNHFMRDWRQDKSTKIDPELFDIIWEIHRELGSKKPVHLISGYRSPKTNAMLRKTRGGQAKKSKHMTGQAADIHFPDVSVKEMRNSALIRERGGVGYYPTSAIPFVHVDTGRVRHWPRLPRKELAILFPEGKSKHIPTDGKPLRKKDFKVALASLKSGGGKLPIAVQRKLESRTDGPTLLASLGPNPKVPVPTPAPEQPKMVFASLTPFDVGSRSAEQPRRAEPRPPVVQASLTPSGTAGPSSRDMIGSGVDEDGLNRSFNRGGPKRPSATVPQDQVATAPEYDDDHPDELNYQPFRVLPLMTDDSVANMRMEGGSGAVDLRKVHLFYNESQQMLLNQFQPGLQYAKLFDAQRFQGKAVNTQIKRLVRKTPPKDEIQTANRPTRTAQR